MADTNLEDVLEQLQFNYGGVLQKLAELHDEVVDQMEMLKTAGTKIRRRNTSYAKDTVLVCVGRNNGNKFLKCKTAGTTSDVQWTEATYAGFTIGSTVTDGSVVWEVMETAFTSGSIVWSAMNASHAEIADYASSAGSATSAGYASSAGYIGPFHVIQGDRVESQSIVSSGVTSTFDGFNVTVQDDTRPIGTGGYIVNGNQNLPVQSFTNFLADGKTLYLFGSSGNPPYFECGFYFGEPKTPGAGEFVTALAKNEGGKIVQMQFGDIVTPWPGAGGGEDYNGPFKVSIDSYNSNTNTVDVIIHDPTDITTEQKYAGRVFANESRYFVSSSSIANVPDSQYIYLIGNSAPNGDITFSMNTTIPSTISEGMFFTRLAQNQGGKIIQIQHGDITVPPWKVNVADYASSAEYYGPFHVSATSGNNVKIYDDSRPGNNGGYVVYGNKSAGISSGLTSFENGERLYLFGSLQNDVLELSYSKFQDGTTLSPSHDEFYTQLAYKSGGKIYQTQFGDIVQPILGGTTTVIDEYDGPFKVTIEGSTVVNSGQINESKTYSIKVRDYTDPSTSPNLAGHVFDGETLYGVVSSSISGIEENAFIYLTGTTGSTPIISDTAGSNTSSSFSIKIAQISDDKVTQIQYGDVYSIPWNSLHAIEADSALEADSASSAGYATSAGYVGPFHVFATNINTTTKEVTVEVFDNTRTNPAIGGCVVLGSTISSAPSSAGISISNGHKLYLIGSSAAGGYTFIYSSTDNPVPQANEFWTQLAYNNGGKVIQTQFGDIVQPQEGVKKIIAGDNITLNPIGGTGEVTISATAAGNSFPKWNNIYSSSCEFESSYTAPADGWVYIDSEIYNNGNPGTAKIELTVGGQIFMINKLTTNGDTDVGVNHGYCMQINSGCTFVVNVTNPNSFIIGLPGSTNGHYYFYSNQQLS